MAFKWREPGQGGFLNGEDATIVGAKFETTDFDGRSALSLMLEIQQDGAEEAVQQFVDFGTLWDGMEVSADGLSVTNDRSPVFSKSNGTRFLDTLVDEENGSPELEEKIAVDANTVSVEALIGVRVTFGKELDKERQIASAKKKLGKKADGLSEEELLKAGRREGKGQHKGKFFNHDRLIVQKVLAVAEAKPAKGKGKAAAPATKAVAPKTATKATKAAPAAPAAGDTDAADAAVQSLIAASKKQAFELKSVSALLMRYAVNNNLSDAEREAIRKQISSEAYLNDAQERGICAYDADTKTVSMPEVE